jgi:exosortase
MPSRRAQRRNPLANPAATADSSPASVQPMNLSEKPAIASAAPRATISELPGWYWISGALITAALIMTLFQPTIAGLIKAWNTEPDYSHGYLVAPFAALLLWLRRDLLPQDSRVPGWGGLGLMAAGFAARYLGERLFLTPVSAWGLVLWLAGAGWLLAGWRAMVWALPGLLFLMFMIPLPFRFEQFMSWHLQTIATTMSTAMFACLGQAAIAEGHTIYLGEHVLEIEQACSGLRMFMGIAAVAFAFVVLHRRPWWEKLLLIVAVAPVAMLSNALRVVATGLLMQIVSGEAAARFSHDAAGWGMIVVAALLFGLLVAYLRRLVILVEYQTGPYFLRRSTSDKPAS